MMVNGTWYPEGCPTFAAGNMHTCEAFIPHGIDKALWKVQLRGQNSAVLNFGYNSLPMALLSEMLEPSFPWKLYGWEDLTKFWPRWHLKRIIKRLHKKYGESNA